MEEALGSLGRVHHLRNWLQAEELSSAQTEEHWGALALAVDGLSWMGSYPLNLLPRKLRPARRRWRYAPTYALLAANALLLVAVGLRAPVQERFLVRQYRQEIAGVQQGSNQIEQVLQKEKKLRHRLELLREFQERGGQPLEALTEIAQRLPPDAWLNLFTYRQGQIELMGMGKSASTLLPLLQASPQLEEVKFNGALTRDASGTERFRLQMRLKAGR
jgi:Tfp pilus assembly protein PilN